LLNFAIQGDYNIKDKDVQMHKKFTDYKYDI